MKSKLFLIIFSSLVSVLVSAAPAPVPPSVPASAYILMDHHTGKVLAEQDSNERMEPASITKIMTAYVVASELQEGNIKLDDQVVVSEKAWRMEGSRMFIEVNTRVSVSDLLHGVIIQSGNDASVALAEHVAGSEEGFASLMNFHAEKLGLSGSHFINSTGLPHDEHYTTAHDMAVLASAFIRHFPDIYAWFSIREFTYNDIKQSNRNKLLWRDETVDGVKTGHTEAAGYCLVASAEREGMRLISVVLGTESVRKRTSASQALLNFGFRFYDTHKLYSAMEPVTSVKVWKGEQDMLSLGVNRDLYITIPRGQYKHLNATMKINEQILAPVNAGEQQGELTVTLGEETLISEPLVALAMVQEGGIFNRISDHVRLMFE